MATQPTLINGVKELQTIEPQPESGMLALIERLAMHPSIDVAKLEQIIAMQERILAYEAKAAFDAAFVRMRPEIPTIIERANTDKTSYAPLEDIIEPVTPILARHGFSLGFRTEWPSDKLVKVVGVLTHQLGHIRESEFQSPADSTGSKNAIQALASTVSYGKRYTTKDLLCIVTRGDDDDGKRGGHKPLPLAPDGFDEWWAHLRTLAEKGLAALEPAWETSDGSYKNYVAKHLSDEWKNLKFAAGRVGKAHERHRSGS